MMELTGEYKLVVYYKLPDGSCIDINELINFSLNDNYDSVNRIKAGSTYFDDSDYGCLETQCYEIRRCFLKLNIINDWENIIKKDEVIKHLEKFYEDAQKIFDNKLAYIRQVKIDILEK